MAKKQPLLPWMNEATKLMGTKEIPGPKSNPVIVDWAEKVGGFTESYYKSDDIPWCGLFVAHCINESGIDIGIKNPLSAREWNKFGIKASPSYGAIMVFSRNGGGHVGFYVSEDKETYHILGGNQSDMVNVTKLTKDRFLGARWPKEYKNLMSSEKIVKKFDGKISRNEA